jgi:hypothetical protein
MANGDLGTKEWAFIGIVTASLIAVAFGLNWMAKSASKANKGEE